MNLGLRGKLLLSVCSILFLSLAVSNTVITVNTYKTSESEALEKTMVLTEKFGNQIQIEIDMALDTARNTALALIGLKTGGVTPDRNVLNQMLKKILEGNPKFMGLWTVWEPDALDGRDLEFIGADNHDKTGRFIPYWNRVGGLHLEPCMEYEDGTTTGYYTYPKATGKEMVTDPVTYEIGGQKVTVVSVCVPIILNGKFLGVAGVDFSMDTMQALVYGIKAYDTGYGLLITSTGVIAAHPQKELVGKEIKDILTPETVSALAKGEIAVENRIAAKTKKKSKFIFQPITLGNTGKPWHIGVGVSMEEVMTKARLLRNLSIGIGLVTLLVLFGAIYFIVGIIIVKPVNEVVEGLKDIAQGDGDTTKRLQAGSKDEIGDLSKAFNLFMEKLQALLTTISGNAHDVDLASSNLAELAQELAEGAENTKNKSHAVSTSTDEMNTSISSVAMAMEEASANINTVASATEEMSATINEIATNSERARSISQDAVSKTQIASNRMHALGQAAQEIGKVTDTINDISNQTNLLALNATIEAARAGEAGKGFAVVASEIKELARQTADATDDIKAKIEGVQSSSRDSVSEIAEVAKVIEDVNDIVSTIASAVEEQAIATSEISGNIGKASQGVSNVGDNISQISAVSNEIAEDIAQVSTLSEKISADGTRVNDNAEGLAKLSSKLKELLSTFKI